MSTEVWILAATAVLAVVAVGAAVIAVRAVRRLQRTPAAVQAAVQPSTQLPSTAPTTSTRQIRSSELVIHDPAPVAEPYEVEGRLIVPPTQQQVVQTALGRPGVRLSVFVHGAAYALRAESRDRIAAMMRREFRRRRRERLQAGRRATRSTSPTAPSDQWMGS